MKAKLKELLRSGFGIVCLVLGMLETIPTFIYRTLLVAIGIILVMTEKGWKNDT